MEIHWHNISFIHSCGQKGNIREFLFARDGRMIVEGFCSLCGEDFEIQDDLLSILAKCTTGDYIQYLAIRKDEVLVIERRESECGLDN